MKLTVKQERFCRVYARTGNASEAYRTAYSAGRMKDTTVNVKASELLKDGKVTVRIEAMRRRAAEAAHVTFVNHLERLDRAYWAALRKGQISAAVSAEKARGEVSGFYSGVRNPLSDPKPSQPAEAEVIAPPDDEVARALLVLQKAERAASGKRREKEALS